MGVPFVLFCVKACFVEAILEVLFLLGLVLSAELGLGRDDHTARGMREDGLHLLVSLLTNAQRLWVLRRLVITVQRYARTIALARALPRELYLDTCSVFASITASLLLGSWYVAKALLWKGAVHCGILWTVGLVNLLMCILWVHLSRQTISSSDHGRPILLRAFRCSRPGTEEAAAQLPFGPFCAVCLIELQEGDKAGQLPCGHTFHEQCIQHWLTYKPVCPMRCADAGTKTGGTQVAASRAPTRRALSRTPVAEDAPGPGGRPAAPAEAAAQQEPEGEPQAGVVRVVVCI